MSDSTPDGRQTGGGEGRDATGPEIADDTEDEPVDGADPGGGTLVESAEETTGDGGSPVVEVDADQRT